MCSYFDDIINATKINFNNVLINKKLYENISVNKISYKSPTGPKPLSISFSKIDGFIISLDSKIKRSVLFDYGLFEKICDKIEYFIRKKSGITNIIILEGLELIHITVYQSKKILSFHNVKILIKSVVHKNENKYYYNIFLEEGLYK